MPGTQKSLIIAHFPLEFRTIAHNSPARTGGTGAGTPTRRHRPRRMSANLCGGAEI
jgi:hypothetical protein